MKLIKEPLQHHCLSTTIYSGVSRVAVNQNTVQQGISVHRLSWALKEEGQ